MFSEICCEVAKAGEGADGGRRHSIKKIMPVVRTVKIAASCTMRLLRFSTSRTGPASWAC